MAVIAVRRQIEKMLYSSNNNKSSNDAKEIVFIVGKGKHSTDKPILMQTILQLLQEEYGINACIDENNAGRIRVPKASIDIVKQKIELDEITP